MSIPELRALSPSEEKDEIDSLPSLSTDDIYSEADSDAQAEWDRSMEQLQLMLTMMIIPFVGKFLGRKFAYWSWTRYMGWYHGADVKWTNKAAFNTVGAIEAASSL
ncbi:unnamed protein product [Clonostachys rosea f. rosea IK726]|uniref:Uncharacterized protein n=2 Tax=Bionectria ochroleuca TaxID=29856 RepID=A0A0B7JSG3_BIOOC|nr:unnamed protein product [Clonostachys rosea f. rosea IK726]